MRSFAEIIFSLCICIIFTNFVDNPEFCEFVFFRKQEETVTNKKRNESKWRQEKKEKTAEEEENRQMRSENSKQRYKVKSGELRVTVASKE